jgi:putative transposase
MKYAFIKVHKGEFSVERMCSVFGVSKSGFYSYCSRERSERAKENEALLDEIMTIYDEHKSRYGSPRIHAELNARGLVCGVHRVARLMQKKNLKAKVHRRVKFNPCKHFNYPEGKDLLQRDFRAIRPNRVWVSDITYVHTDEGWIYLTVILDLYSRAVVGHTISDDMRKEIVIKAFTQAKELRKPSKGLIFHSDRGMQYISDAFQDRLRASGAHSSMSRKGNCFDNAVAESFFHTLKTELVSDKRYHTKLQARESLFEYVAVYYNNNRRHSYLNYLTPREFEASGAHT